MIQWTNKDSVLAAVRRFPAIFEQEITATLEHIALVLAGATADLAPVGTGAGGNLANSIQAERPTPTSYGWRCVYGTSVEYAEVIEYGRSPGSKMPPVDALARWVWLKRDLFEGVATEKDARQVAFAIGRHIARHGFTSGPVAGKEGGTAWAMFSRAIEQQKDEVGTLWHAVRGRIEKRCQAALDAA